MVKTEPLECSDIIDRMMKYKL